MFQRFTVVMAYEQKPVLPPPLIILSHAYLLLKWLKRKTRGVRETYDNGLKLFLEKDDMERLYDFEEECVEGYFREQVQIIEIPTISFYFMKNHGITISILIRNSNSINPLKNASVTPVKRLKICIKK